MFQTIQYRPGCFIQLQYANGREYIRASCLGADLGEFRSLHAAKIAITRDRREYLAKRAADHHEAIREIWGQK